MDPKTDSTVKVEGAFYAFTYGEIEEICKNIPNSFAAGIDAFEVYIYHYNIRPEGNVEPKNDPHGHLLAKNILYVSGSSAETADKFKITPNEVDTILTVINNLLHEYRDKRPRPHLDTKIICAWNGLTLSGISKLSTIQHAPDHEEYLRVANKLVDFIRENMFDASVGKLYRARYVDDAKEIAAIS